MSEYLNQNGLVNLAEIIVVLNDIEQLCVVPNRF
jgi:hypothetical protein